MPTADANGIRIHYEVHGEGRPLLLILGLGADVSEYTALIDQLAARSRVIAFDNRGAGRTDKPDAPYSIELMAADALGVMDALGVTRADVLGISLGGRIALELALGHPERVERLILVSTSARVVPSLRRRRLYPTLSGCRSSGAVTRSRGTHSSARWRRRPGTTPARASTS
jgi:3-oxoadipate enol-lactonase